jgi:hypothetical protein
MGQARRIKEALYTGFGIDFVENNDVNRLKKLE